MRALCPDCGLHHEVVRVLDDEARGEARKDVYQIAALEACARTWLSESDLLEARARFGEEALLAEEDDVE